MTTGRLCQSYPSSNRQSYAAPVSESPSIGGNDSLDEILIPTCDDVDDIIDKMFDDEDAATLGCHEEDCDAWGAREGVDGSSDEEEKGKYDRVEPLAPWLRNRLSTSRHEIPIISSDESDDDGAEKSEDDSDEFSLEGEDSNEENRGDGSGLRPRLYRSHSGDCQRQFSLSKHIMEKSKNSAVAAASLTTSKLDLCNAVLSQAPGEVLIRAHLLQRHHLPDALDIIRRFAYPTHRLVIEEVHQGAAVEALLIYLFEATHHASGSDALRSVRYTGSWISPTLISYLASSETRVEEIELGLALYPKSRSRGRRSARRSPVRNVARQLQRAEELEEALAANTSLRVLRLLSSCHVKITEGLLWAASCQGRLESIALSLPIRTPISTADVHESGILAYEGLAEVIRQTSCMTNISIRVNPRLCRPRQDTHEPVQAAREWKTFCEALQATTSLTHLRIEFDAVAEVPATIANDMSTNLMQGFAKNMSLHVLELVNAPCDSAMDLLYGVHTRKNPLKQVTLRQCPEIVSSLMCVEDDEDREVGWWAVSSLRVDQASLTRDLLGLEILAKAGGLEKLVVTDNLPKKDAKRLMEVLNGESKVESLVMGHDSPGMLASLESKALRSLELRGGRYPVSPEMAGMLLDGCPALRRLELTNVRVDGDWSCVLQRMDSHALETLEINERDEHA